MESNEYSSGYGLLGRYRDLNNGENRLQISIDYDWVISQAGRRREKRRREKRRTEWRG